MKVVWNFLQRMCDRVRPSLFGGLISPGNWFVVYETGRRTCFMDYRSVKNQQAIFGGKIFHRNQLDKAELLMKKLKENTSE